MWYLSTVTAMTSKSRGGPPPLIPPNPCLIPPQPPLPPPPSPMPTASLTVKGQIGEYKLEVNSQEGLAQLVQVVEKFADIESQMTMAAHLRYQTQLQNEQMMRFQCMNVPLAITSMFPPVLVPQVGPSDTTAGDKTSQSVGQSRSVNDICLPGAIVRMHEYRGKQNSSQYSSMQRLTGLDLQQYTVQRAAGVTDMVQEVQHPILKQFYVTSPLAGFWCATLSDLRTCTHCDWEQLYTLVLGRIKSDLSAVKPRIQNALETGMVIETTFH